MWNGFTNTTLRGPKIDTSVKPKPCTLYKRIYYSVIVYILHCKSNNNVNKKNEEDQKKGNTPEVWADLLWVTDTGIFTRFHNWFMWLRLSSITILLCIINCSLWTLWQCNMRLPAISHCVISKMKNSARNNIH